MANPSKEEFRKIIMEGLRERKIKKSKQAERDFLAYQADLSRRINRGKY